MALGTFVAFWTISLLIVCSRQVGAMEPIALCSSTSTIDRVNNTGVIGYEGEALPCSVPFLIPPHTFVTFNGTTSTCPIVSCPLPIDLKLNDELFCPEYGRSHVVSSESSSKWRLNVVLSYGSVGQAIHRPSFDFSFKLGRLLECQSHASAQGVHNHTGELYLDANLRLYNSTNCWWQLRNIPYLSSIGETDESRAPASVLVEILDWGKNATGLQIQSTNNNTFIFNSTHQDRIQFPNASQLTFLITDPSSSVDWRVVLKYTVLVCNDPPAIEYGFANRTHRPYERNGTTISYLCANGYSWNNSIPLQRRCLHMDNGLEWILVADSQCIPDAKCETDPVERNGAKFTFFDGFRGTYACADGYHPAEGSPTSLTIKCKSVNNRPYEWETPNGVLVCVPDSLVTCGLMDQPRNYQSLCRNDSMVPNCCRFNPSPTQCQPKDCEESWMTVAIIFIVVTALLAIALVLLFIKSRGMFPEVIGGTQCLNSDSKEVDVKMNQQSNGSGPGATSQSDTHDYYNVKEIKKGKQKQKKKKDKDYENQSAINLNQHGATYENQGAHVYANQGAHAYVNQGAPVYDEVPVEGNQQFYVGADLANGDAYEDVAQPQPARKALMPPTHKKKANRS